MWRVTKQRIDVWTDRDLLFRVFNVLENYSKMEKSESIAALNWTRNQLFVWKMRSDQSKDLMEWEATYALLSAIVEDIDDSRDKMHLHTSVCALYALAVVKFFNILQFYQVDENGEIKKCSRKILISLKSTATNLDLPQWFVDCRNRICHSMVPSLTLLRQASFIAFQWLRVHYWQKLIERELSTTNNKEIAIDLLESLNKLVSGDSNERKQMKQLIKRALDKNSAFTISVIAHYLVESSSEDFDYHKFDESLTLPPEMDTKYSSLLGFLSKEDLLPYLLQKLIQMFKEDDEDTCKRAETWFAVVMSLYSKKNASFTKHLKRKNDNKKSGKQKIIWLRLLYSVMREPNKYTPSLIPIFRELLGRLLPESKASLLQKLGTIYTQQANECRSVADEMTLKTVDDLKVLSGSAHETPQLSFSASGCEMSNSEQFDNV